jgi:hypothetical protein
MITLQNRFPLSFPTLACLCCLVFGTTDGLLAEQAPTKDVAGHDHPLVKRYEGSVIVEYTQKAFEEYKIILGKSLNPSSTESNGKRVEKQQAVEGKITRITYFTPKGRAPLEVFRNYENELKTQGRKPCLADRGRTILAICLGYSLNTKDWTASSSTIAARMRATAPTR